MITRATEYACLAMLHLAQRGQGVLCDTASIAEDKRIPPSFLPKVVHQLSKAGLVLAKRGPGGGIELARDPQQVTLREVIEAVEGALVVNVCTSEGLSSCYRTGCGLQQAFSQAQLAYREALASFTLSQLVEQDRYQAPSLVEA
jgi:Rrf2 family protein